MNSITGKSTGIALLMAAALLAALFAMGVFSAGTVGAHGTDDHTAADDERAHGTVTGEHEHATISDITVNAINPDDGTTTDADDDPDVQSDDLVPIADNLDDLMAAVTAPGDAIGLRVTFTPGDNSEVGSVMAHYSDGSNEALTVVDGVANAYDVSIDKKVLARVTAVASDSRTDTTAVLVDDTYTVAVTSTLATSKDTPGSNQSLEVTGEVVYTDTDNIVVDFKDFGGLSDIETNQVVVNNGANSANPSDIEVDGSKVTLVAPFDPEDADQDDLSIAEDGGTIAATTITFRRAAGITLPIRHGDYDLKVSTSETEDDGVLNWVTVRRQLSVKPTSGTRGKEVTISGKGFTDGTAELTIGDTGYSIDVGVVDGEFSEPVDSAVKNNNNKSVFSGTPNDDGKRLTSITISDAALNGAPPKTFEIKPSFTLDPREPSARPGCDHQAG